MKKIITYLLVLVMLLASSASVLAQTTISIVNPTGASEIYEGESLNIKATLSENSAYKVAFYLNGDWVSTVYASDTPECEITNICAGSNTVRADALSASGTVLATDTVTFSVNANEAPVVSVAGLDSEIDLSLSDTVSASVTDSEDNFTEAKVFLNGIELGTYTETSFDIDISSAASGENALVIEAVDAYGKKGIFEKIFTAKQEIVQTLVENNFDDYTSGTPAKFTNFVTNKGASYSAVTTEDESYGTSLCLTANTIENSPDVDAHIYLGTDSGKQKFVVKTSYYFPGNADGNHDATATLYFRAGNGSSRELVDFDKNGKLKCYGEAGIKSTTYDLNTWYDMELYIDTRTGMYDVILNGTPVIEGYTNVHIRDLGISAFRFGICTRTGHSGAHPASDVGAKVYMDNISVVSILDVPKIEKVYSEGNTDTVSGGVGEIKAKLSAVIDGSDILENVTLMSEFGEVNITDAVYDSQNLTVTVTTDAEIQPGADYTLIIKEGTKMTSTLKTVCDIRCGFTAENGDYSVPDGKFEFSDGKITFKGSVDNKTSLPLEAIAVMYVWQENKIVSAYTTAIVATEDRATEFTVTGKPLVKGERASVYVFDADTLEMPVTVKNYSYSN